VRRSVGGVRGSIRWIAIARMGLILAILND